MMFDITYAQHQLVYNALSFTFASMMASTVYFFLRLGSVSEKYKAALVITGLVTFIAAYHYIRIFNSWVDAYEFPSSTTGEELDPVLTGVPFNDAYRYMDWLLTVPLLLLEIVFVMKLSPEETSQKGWSLGVASALMIAVGYPGELIVTGDLTQRLTCWMFSMVIFSYIVYELKVGLTKAIKAEEDEKIAGLIDNACTMTVISWLTYPVVYMFPFFGISGAHSVIAIQIGYCFSDVISKCGVGLLICKVTIAKSAAEKAEPYARLEDQK